MQRKHQLIFTAVISAAIMLMVGAVSGLYLSAPAAHAETAVAPAAQAEAAPARTITVVGEGKVSAPPDVAQINMGIEVVGPDIMEATSQAETTMNALLAALQAEGVAENDIQTSYYNVWVERPYSPDGSPTGDAIYHVSNTVNVTVRDLANLTNILGKAIETGANTINSISFSLADPTALKSQAREEAVADAEAKAAELAGLNGVTVGEVMSISELVGNAIPFAYDAAVGLGGGGAGPISPGEVEVTTQLQISYAIE
jgi:uncharacterized protein YggE